MKYFTLANPIWTVVPIRANFDRLANPRNSGQFNVNIRILGNSARVMPEAWEGGICNKVAILVKSSVAFLVLSHFKMRGPGWHFPLGHTGGALRTAWWWQLSPPGANPWLGGAGEGAARRGGSLGALRADLPAQTQKR